MDSTDTQQEQVFSLTDKAVRHVLRTLEREGRAGHGLRISVVAGGCSGYEYALDFAEAPQDGDTVVRHGDLAVFIDTESIPRLQGTVLDYVDGLYGAVLKFANPQAVHSCGCGTSFATESAEAADGGTKANSDSGPAGSN